MVVVVQRCQSISVLNASILLGWKRIHFTAISAEFAGKLIQFLQTSSLFLYVVKKLLLLFKGCM